MTADPLCPVFGTCGGCAHQHLDYAAELEAKESELRALLGGAVPPEAFRPIVPSPRPYHYRSRLDVGFRRLKDGRVVMGFAPGPARGARIVPIESCAIALEGISDFLPELARRAEARLPARYRLANLVVKTGDDGRVLWGGIGRRSLETAEADYLWTDVAGVRVFYALGTFFQANLSILPRVAELVEELAEAGGRTVFGDLYAGVGLFGLALARRVRRVVFVEDHPASVRLLKHNVAFHGLANAEIRAGRVEDAIADVAASVRGPDAVFLADPPRKGLGPRALEGLSAADARAILYLSCEPRNLARDLGAFGERGWAADAVVPLDFFPKTRHLETLVRLRRRRGA